MDVHDDAASTDPHRAEEEVRAPGRALHGEPISVPDPSDPGSALAAVVALRRLAEQLEFAAVPHAVEQGWTWAEIAGALGVTRQAAHKRHARRVRDSRGGRR